MIGELLSEYARLEQEILAHFNYEPQWREYLIRDYRDLWWGLVGHTLYYQYENNLATDEVLRQGNFCTAEVRSVYHSADGHTMVCLDTNTDGNKYLGVFEDSKRVESELLDGY